MASKDKDTIYIDIDDEITGIIDKLKGSQSQVVALVLPKRASVFQSIVNMKLLKRAADSAKKNVVLITSEAGLLPLAGAAGIHVAKTLTSKPEIPLGPQLANEADDEAIEEDELPAEPLANKDKTVGELAGNTVPPPPADGGVETLVLDDDVPPEVADAAAAGPKGAKTFEPPKGKKNKKLRIPNFERFRLLLIIGGALLVLLIAGLVFATVSLPKATINIKTDATNVDVNLSLNLSTSATATDPSTGILPAKLAQQSKTYTQQVPTTGQKNNGNKAQGTVAMTAGPCSPNVPNDVPAGTGLSYNNQTYITQSNVSFTPTVSKGKCTFQGIDGGGQANISITAQSGGTSFNVSGVTFSVSGRSDVSASGSASNGTDSIVQTVNQNDINNAKSKISATNDTAVKQDLDSQLKGDNYYPIEATYNTATPVVTSSANVGDVASNVTVTETISYTMFGVKQSDLNALIDNNVNAQIDTSKQSILDTGLNQAVFNVNTISASSAQLSMSTKATAGPQLNTDNIKQQAAGKRIGEIKSQISGNPDVTSVDVSLSPFWVSTAPKNTKRITVNIAKPTTSLKASKSSANSP